MSQALSIKSSKVVESREVLKDHLKSLPEENCDDEDFVVWGKQYIELKVRRKNCFSLFFG
jgi:hypothetical protein